MNAMLWVAINTYAEIPRKRKLPAMTISFFSYELVGVLRSLRCPSTTGTLSRKNFLLHSGIGLFSTVRPCHWVSASTLIIQVRAIPLHVTKTTTLETSTCHPSISIRMMFASANQNCALLQNRKKKIQTWPFGPNELELLKKKIQTWPLGPNELELLLACIVFLLAILISAWRQRFNDLRTKSDRHWQKLDKKSPGSNHSKNAIISLQNSHWCEEHTATDPLNASGNPQCSNLLA